MLIQSFAFHANDSKTQSDSSDWEVHSLLVAGTWPWFDVCAAFLFKTFSNFLRQSFVIRSRHGAELSCFLQQQLALISDDFGPRVTSCFRFSMQIWGHGGASFDPIGAADRRNSPHVELGRALLLIWSSRFAEGRVDACEGDVSRKSAILPVCAGVHQCNLVASLKCESVFVCKRFATK